MGAGKKLWGYYPAGDAWLPIICDANGRLRVDLSNVDLGDLGDVIVAGVADGDGIIWNAAASEWQVAASAAFACADLNACDLGDLGDVNVAGVANRDVLQWMAGAGGWWPAAIPAAVYLEGTVAKFQANAATGTFSISPANINDNDTTSNGQAQNVGEYAEVDFGEVVQLSQYRHYGTLFHNGDGEWKLQYYNLSTHAWTDWITGISTRPTNDWSSWVHGSTIATDKIRLVGTVMDSGVGLNMAYEWEVKY